MLIMFIHHNSIQQMNYKIFFTLRNKDSILSNRWKCFLMKQATFFVIDTFPNNFLIPPWWISFRNNVAERGYEENKNEFVESGIRYK